MRHGRLVAVTAVALVGLTSCADRPNDLDTYYDDPTTAAGPPATDPAPRPTPRPAPAPPGPPAHLVDAVGAARLTEADVAAEGVVPVAGLDAPSGCLARLPAEPDPALRTAATWQYPTGSRLSQEVTGYPGRAAAGLVRGFACADGQPVQLAAPQGVEAHRAWCVGDRCTVLLARGHVVSAVQVAAGSAERAVQAAIRLAPVAAAALTRQP